MIKEIPKTYEANKYEDEIYKLWEESGFFNPDNLKLPKNAKSYSIMMPPPNVTGVLHLGHALENSIMDVMARYQRMQGKKVLLLPGTDHAAVATQARVEKNLIEDGMVNPREELGREGLLEKIQEYAEESKSTILKQVRKMGTSADWSRLAYTFDEDRNKAVNEVFEKMYKDGLIYRGYRVVNWSVKGKSTCSDDELIYIDRKAKLYTFKYSTDFPFMIATTRPETKLGDTAVAVNPKDKRYNKYIGQIFNVDFCGNKLKLKIIADKNVDPKFGTGALGVTPAHSLVDFEMYENRKTNGDEIDIIQIIGEDGKMMASAGKEFEGLTVEEAREKVVKKLKERKLFISEEEIDQNVGTSDRFGDIVEAIPMKQWWLNMQKEIPGRGKSLRDLMKEAVTTGLNGSEAQKIIINPERFKKLYLDRVNNLRDWCLSRQIWWGHRIPVWYKEKEIIVGSEKPNGNGWVQDEDTLDTWFSSGLWTFSTLGWPSEKQELKTFHPTSWMQMGYEILYLWFMRMVLMSVYNLGEIPFKNTYIHGMLRDKNGNKFSKSAKNGIDPLEIIEKYGTDALRWSLLLGSTPGNDMRFYLEKVEAAQHFVTKLWNIYRFIGTTFPDVKLEEKISKKNIKTTTDRWIVSKLNVLVLEMTNDLDNYKFSLAGEKLYNFVWSDFADWQIEISKIEKNKYVLGYVLGCVLKLVHPFMPFVTEKIYGDANLRIHANTANKKIKMLMVEKWPVSDKKLIDKKSEKEFLDLQEMIVKIRNIRSSYRIAPSEIISASSQKLKNQEIIEKLGRVKFGEKIKQGIEVSEKNIRIILGIAELIDVEKEKKNFEKEIANLENLISKNSALLANKNFLASAPKEIVENNKIRIIEYKNKLKIQKELFSNLNNLEK